jgi:hypothetical protein
MTIDVIWYIAIRLLIIGGAISIFCEVSNDFSNSWQAFKAYRERKAEAQKNSAGPSEF